MEPTPPVIGDQDGDISREFLSRALESKSNQADWNLILKVCDEFILNQGSMAAEVDRLRVEHDKIAKQIVALKKQQWKVYVRMVSIKKDIRDEDKKKRVVKRVWHRIIQRCAAIRKRVVQQRVLAAVKGDSSYDDEPWSDERIEESIRSKPIDSGLADESEIGLEDNPDGGGGGEDGPQFRSPEVDSGAETSLGCEGEEDRRGVSGASNSGG
jgi:hypothetical protein